MVIFISLWCNIHNKFTPYLNLLNSLYLLFWHRYQSFMLTKNKIIKYNYSMIFCFFKIRWNLIRVIIFFHNLCLLVPWISFLSSKISIYSLWFLCLYKFLSCLYKSFWLSLFIFYFNINFFFIIFLFNIYAYLFLGQKIFSFYLLTI